MGLLNSGDLNKGFSYSVVHLILEIFSLFYQEEFVPKIGFVKLFCCCIPLMSFRFEFLFSSSLGLIFLKGEAITSVPCTIMIFISSK